jgi:hypothetical protein
LTKQANFSPQEKQRKQRGEAAFASSFCCSCFLCGKIEFYFSMSEINPYESPQEERSPRWNTKPPAFWLALVLQGICLMAAIICVLAVGTTRRGNQIHNMRDFAAIMSAFAVLMGLGVIIAAQRYALQGWVVFESLLLTFLMFLFFVG